MPPRARALATKPANPGSMVYVREKVNASSSLISMARHSISVSSRCPIASSFQRASACFASLRSPSANRWNNPAPMSEGAIVPSKSQR